VLAKVIIGPLLIKTANAELAVCHDIGRERREE
jgi:hypothetical protein